MFRVFFLAITFFIINISGNIVLSATVDVSGEAEEAPYSKTSAPNASGVNNNQSNTPAKKTLSKKLNLAENNPVAALLCKGIRAFTGTVAKIIAVLMLIGLGIALLAATNISPVTPVTFMAVMLAVGLLFSSEYLVGRLMGDAGVGGMQACDCKYGLNEEYCKTK